MPPKALKSGQDIDVLFEGTAERLEQKMVPADQMPLSRLPGKVTPVSLELPEDYPLDDLVALTDTLYKAGVSVSFWLGDALRFGKRIYGNMYAEALEKTGLKLGTLKNIVYVAEHVEKSRRRDFLSWSHHQVVASLPPKEQNRWLLKAGKNGWTRGQLRAEIKKAKEDESNNEQDQDPAKHPLIQRINQFKSHLASMKDGEIGQLNKVEAQIFLSTIAECRKDIGEMEQAIAGKFGL